MSDLMPARFDCEGAAQFVQRVLDFGLPFVFVVGHLTGVRQTALDKFVMLGNNSITRMRRADKPRRRHDDRPANGGVFASNKHAVGDET